MTRSETAVGPVGLASVEAACALLQRLRRAHPTAGTLEAADVQWWWRSPRASDAWPALVRPGADGAPAAMVLATDWGDAVALDPIVPPGWADADLAALLDEAVARFAPRAGERPLAVVLDEADAAAHSALLARGFAPDPASDLAVATAWLALGERPAQTPPRAPYRLVARADADVARVPHWLARRNGSDVEPRLRQTSLYLPDLDLAAIDRDGAVAAYAMAWHDSATGVGLVEPVRTEDGHRRRGLARHLIVEALDRLAALGASRAKVCFAPSNPASRALYAGLGFRPERGSVVLVRSVDRRSRTTVSPRNAAGHASP